MVYLMANIHNLIDDLIIYYGELHFLYDAFLCTGYGCISRIE